MNHVRKVGSLGRWAVVVSAVMVMQGCGTSHVSELRLDGTVVGQPVFPPLSDAWQKEGSFPNIESLRQVKTQMTKDQLYYLLGRPHFREGLMFVREWDYIFHFRNGPNPEDFTTCRFKVTFEKTSSSSEFLSKEMYWTPESCADFARPAAPAAAQVAPPTPVAIATPPARNTLSTDVRFAFDSSGEVDLVGDSLPRLEKFASELKGMVQRGKVRHVKVTGYTDHIGSTSYNARLSEMRAVTVKTFLVGQGIPSDLISARGQGVIDGTECERQRHSDLIACLQPDRRVDVLAELIEK